MLLAANQFTILYSPAPTKLLSGHDSTIQVLTSGKLRIFVSFNLSVQITHNKGVIRSFVKSEHFFDKRINLVKSVDIWVDNQNTEKWSFSCKLTLLQAWCYIFC